MKNIIDHLYMMSSLQFWREWPASCSELFDKPNYETRWQRRIMLKIMTARLSELGIPFSIFLMLLSVPAGVFLMLLCLWGLDASTLTEDEITDYTMGFDFRRFGFKREWESARKGGR